MLSEAMFSITSQDFVISAAWVLIFQMLYPKYYLLVGLLLLMAEIGKDTNVACLHYDVYNEYQVNPTVHLKIVLLKGQTQGCGEMSPYFP
jgi:hypothetical protein